MFRELRHTVMSDIDGTIFQQRESLSEMISGKATVLP